MGGLQGRVEWRAAHEGHFATFQASHKQVPPTNMNKAFTLLSVCLFVTTAATTTSDLRFQSTNEFQHFVETRSSMSPKTLHACKVFCSSASLRSTKRDVNVFGHFSNGDGGVYPTHCHCYRPSTKHISCQERQINDSDEDTYFATTTVPKCPRNNNGNEDDEYADDEDEEDEGETTKVEAAKGVSGCADFCRFKPSFAWQFIPQCSQCTTRKLAFSTFGNQRKLVSVPRVPMTIANSRNDRERHLFACC